MTDHTSLADREARARITSDLDTSLLVEAAAGTGKTTSMVARMTALLRTGRTRIEHLAAMTFTVKAAGHLREKFEQSLRAAVRESGDREEIAYLSAALDDIDRPFIGTIHAFCATLLRERPLEAGVDPGFAVLDETEAALLRARVFHDFMRDGENTSPSAAGQEGHHIPLAALRDAYEQLCANPDVEFPAPAVPEPDLSAAFAQLCDLIEDLGALLPPDSASNDEDRLQSLLRATMRQPYRTTHDTAGRATLLAPFRSGEDLVRLKSWRDLIDDAKTDVRERCGAFAAEFVEPALRSWESFLYPAAIAQARRIAARWETEKQRRGLCTNDDLLILTRDMLRDHPAVREELQQRFTHLLVDEFQDTDPVQAEIMLYLTGEDTTERDWHRLRPRPGSLFVVGDPRQSIYRFRRADITVYNSVARILEANGSSRLRLSSSFRALPAVCDWVNTRFAEVFPAAETPYQAAHVPLTAVRSGESPLRGAYAMPITYSGMKSSATMLAEETALLAQWTASALAAEIRIAVRADDGTETQRVLAPRDILLLTPTNAGIDAFAAAMEQRGIPVTVAGGYALRDRKTLRPLMHILHALADPLDEISVVAYLRGPLCGADDAALADYRARGGQFTFFSPVIKGADTRILDGLAFLKGKVRLLRSLPPAAVIGSIIEEAGLLSWTASAERGNLRAGTLQRLVEFAQAASARGQAFADIVSGLDAAMERSRVDGIALFPDANAVRIMNVHKAKGLEAPVVILARHNGARTGRDLQTVCIDRRTQPPRGVMRVQQRFPGGGAVPVAVAADWEDVRAVEQQYLDAERERLQYVAATRAECVLLVVRRSNESKTPDSWDVLLRGSLEDAPEFPAAPDTAESHAPTLPSPRQVKDEIERRRIAAAQKSYVLQSPSRLAHPIDGGAAKGGPEHTPASDGQGRHFGSAAHRILETALRDSPEDARLLIAPIAEEMKLDGAQQDMLREMLERAVSNALWQRMSAATRCYTELPFGEMISGDRETIPTVMRGTIDAVFEENGVWTIVDYKTDEVRDADDPRVAQYRQQIGAYRDAWERITGQRPRALLWFVRTDLIAE